MAKSAKTLTTADPHSRMRKKIGALEKNLAKKGGKRWKAAVEFVDVARSNPELVWWIVLQHGASGDEDLQQAVGTCILEHVLEFNFEPYFSLLETEIRRGIHNLGRTFNSCYKLGQATKRENSRKWDCLHNFVIDNALSRARLAAKGGARRRKQ